MDLVSVFVLLFLVMDPLGNVPLFLSALENVAPERRARVLVRELLIALGFMMGFLLASSKLRDWLGRRGLIAVERLMGMVLVAIAVQMFLDGLRSALQP